MLDDDDTPSRAPTPLAVGWDDEDVANFLGCYLSEPKSHIFFDTPAKALSEARFRQAVQTSGLTLDMKTQMQCHGSTVFINGELNQVSKASYRALRELADTRTLAAGISISDAVGTLLYEWYLDGYLTPAKGTRRRSK